MKEGERLPFILISVVLWASTFPLISYGLDYFPPMVMAVLRYGIALFPLFFYLSRYTTISKMKDSLKNDMHLWVGIGITTVTLPQLLQNYAMLHVSASVTSIIQATSPVFSVAFGIVLLKELAGPKKIAGLAIALAGAIYLSAGGDFSGLDANMFWSMLILLSALVYASSGVMAKNGLERYGPLEILTYSTLAGTLLSIPFLILPGEAAWFSAPTLSLSPMLTLLYLATLPTCLAMILWFRVLAEMEYSKLALYVYLIPVVATAMSVMFFGDAVTLPMVVGGFVIISGVALAQTENVKRGR
ncbi:MAG: DMT family transporter [Candidatus Thermoplasmatota archaeon]|nr:DMT family transporter [Candidatus Thermoplasmatota archaeon]